MRILFVCSANVSGSPVAERLTSAWAEQALGPSAATVRVRSRGLDAVEGRPINPLSAAALRDLGGNPDACYARQLIPDEVDGAHLVLTMTRRHRHEVLKVAPRGLRRTFTLLEAGALMDRADLAGLTSLPLAERAAELATRLNAVRSRRPATAEDDLLDAVGRSDRDHAAAVRFIARGVRPLAEVLFAPVASASPTLA